MISRRVPLGFAAGRRAWREAAGAVTGATLGRRGRPHRSVLRVAATPGRDVA